MKLKQYQKYKETNIDWIGKIPNEWNIKKIKHFSISIAGGTPNTTTLSYWDGNIPWLPSGMIHDDLVKIEDVKTFITLEGLQNSSTKWIKKDAVLVALTGATCANIAYLTFRATANQSVIGIECDDKSYPKFFFYYLLSQREQILLNKTGGAQAGINKEDVKNLICAYPIKETQKSIANFLDKKTTNINNLLEKDKHLIELFKEKRIALINHVVTKGLNSKAKFKDSGIDWIDKVPDGWEVKKLKQISEINISNVDKKSEEGESDVSLCNYIDVYKNEFIDATINFMKATASVEQIRRFAIKKGDVIITKDSEEPTDIAIPALVVEDLKNVVCGYHLALIRSNKKILEGAFLLRALQSKKINDQFVIEANGVTRFGISTYPIINSYILIPPKTEQTQIIEYLDKATSKIDEAVKKIEKRIELLEEYKKSLIHNVVTGKVNVQGGEK